MGLETGADGPGLKSFRACPYYALMKRFSCGDVVPGCQHTFRAQNEAHLLEQIAAHAARDYGLAELSPELVSKVREQIREAS